MEILLFISILISFLTALITLPFWIKKARKLNLLWEDMNKYKHPKNVASSGGIIVVMAFVLGTLSYIAIRTFLIDSVNGVTLGIFALLSCILIFAIIGLVDDLLGWQHGGLSVKLRLLLAIVASIPLVVINAGDSIMNFPFIGPIELGLLYPLFIIPLGIVGASTTYNFLAGFSGLEAGQGIIVITFLSFIAYVTGTSWLALMGLIMVAALIVFYIFNKDPARVFPGDVLTYSVGALIAIMAILGNFEKIAVFIFIPYILETLLKLRGGLKKQSFAKPNPDDSLELPYKKVYGLTHISLLILKKFKRKVYLKDVTYLIFAFQIIICLLALIIFKGDLFL
jgi:UDP-N-acetylglucosamine--dolichyl-phosphate N-acetylglucosaminephosphotransferase